MSCNQLENKISNLSISDNSTKQEIEQPLKCSTYNINEAYDFDVPYNFSLILDSASVHPLQKQDDLIKPYAFDLSSIQPKTKQQPNEKNVEELHGMMKDLSLSPNSTARNYYLTCERSRSMPYCV